MLYNNLILPHLYYCLLLIKENYVAKKRAMKTITDIWNRAHTTTIFKV